LLTKGHSSVISFHKRAHVIVRPQVKETKRNSSIPGW